MSDKKKVAIALVFQRKGHEGTEVFSYAGVNRTQIHTTEYGNRVVTIHKEKEVHTHSETCEYRLVRTSKYFE